MKNFNLSWVDLLILALLVVGFFRGRKRGMSLELLSLLQWLLIVVAGAHFYEPLGKALSNASPFSLLASYIAVYIGIALALQLVFTWVRRAVGEKLVGSDLFGKAEYYLGMIAGTIRFACIILMGLAILHARAVNMQQQAAQERRQKEELGSTFFPSFGKVQNEIFSVSYSGQFVEKQLSGLLIKPTAPGGKGTSQDSIKKKRESTIDDVLSRTNR